MDIIVALMWIISGFVALLTLVFLIEILVACFALKRRSISLSSEPEASSTTAAILIPAHNEEDVIEATINSILPQLRQGDEVVVVADNCTDNTKQIAEQYNVTVIERNDHDRKGKGYALDFALSYIKDKSFGAILMVDADCILESGCRDSLVAETIRTSRPIQCLYLMHGSSSDASISQKVSEFAWVIKNKLRPLGLLTLKGPCHLMGTGMAFPASMLDEMELATGCIVEDMKLGLDLAVAGSAPKFLPDALVWSRFPETESLEAGQKSRWIHGHIEMIFLYVPVLLREFFKKRDINLLLICLELLIPPLILLLMINVAVLMLSLFLTILGDTKLYILSVSSVMLMVLALMMAWLFEGRKIVSLQELFSGLLSRLKSASVYLKFFTDRRKDWNKTSRK
ncbi:MAG: glycosyltransferase family 2 protein [Cellvibrionaceae bacterium]